MKILSIIAILGFFVSSKAEDLTPIFLGTTSKGLHHIDMRVADFAKTQDGKLIITARGDYQGKPASLTFVLDSAWKGLPTGGQYYGKAEIRSTGVESQVFARAVAAAFQQRSEGAALVDRQVAGIVSVKPATMIDAPFWIELIYGSAPSKAYTEFNVYIDLKGKRLRLQEGDPRFKDGFVRLFTDGK